MTGEQASADAPGRRPPLPAAVVAAGKVSRSGLQVADGVVYWSEARPADGGRQVVVADAPGGATDVSPAGRSVRSRVHGYGGGAATVADGVLYTVDQTDQRWARSVPGSDRPPEPLAGQDPPADAGEVRRGDGRVVPGSPWFLTVEERTGPTGTTHRIVALPLAGAGPGRVVVEDGGFVAAPRPAPDGRFLAWTAWSPPAMPWDSSEVRVAPLTTGADGPVLGPARRVAGGPGVSVGQPQWCPDGALLLVDDRTGWWLPYRLPAGADGPGAAVALAAGEVEFHAPDWVLGQATLAVRPDGSVVGRMGRGGGDRLVVLRPGPGGPDAEGWSLDVVDQPCVTLAGVACPDRDRVVVLGTTPTEAHVVLEVDPAGRRPPVRRSAPPVPVPDPDEVARAEPFVAHRGGAEVPGHFFAPPAGAARPTGGGPPPLVVFCHGGPTGAGEAGWDPVVQFLAARGLAVAVVDYRGSSGHGRAYRDALRGAWGVADADDCVAYAEALAAAGRVDPGRMAVRGTSAGGFTALCALRRARVFTAAVAWYGVTDLAALAAETHDFEAHYLDGLVGPLPEAAAVYRARSPLHHAAGLAGRVLLLQGADDPVVPASQSERFAAELAGHGVSCELVVFPGEGHGFRRAATIEAALGAELAFYTGLFGPEAMPAGAGKVAAGAGAMPAGAGEVADRGR